MFKKYEDYEEIFLLPSSFSSLMTKEVKNI